MSANWDYAQLAKTASEHGGPQPYLNFVKGVAKTEGRLQGAAVAILLTPVAIAGGKKVLDQWRAKRQLAAEAERELLRGMRDASDPADPDPNAPIDGEGQ